MKILLDSHILLWLGYNNTQKIANDTKLLLENIDNELYFSLVSIWELTIKASLNKPNFPDNVEGLRKGLLINGLQELPITAKQIFRMKTLPKIHGDPFDRLLIAQAIMENMHFLTVDEKILEYPFDLILNAKK